MVAENATVDIENGHGSTVNVHCSYGCHMVLFYLQQEAQIEDYVDLIDKTIRHVRLFLAPLESND